MSLYGVDESSEHQKYGACNQTAVVIILLAVNLGFLTAIVFKILVGKQEFYVVTWRFYVFHKKKNKIKIKLSVRQ